MINLITGCKLVTPPSHLILVLLSDGVQLSPVLISELLQLPLVILLHFVTHFLKDVGQLCENNR